MSDAPFEYVFPAIRGIQASREYYVSMCPMRLIPKLFLFDEEELVPELRAQRQLNKARIPEIARYITENPESYVFSAITASVDADVEFEPFFESGDGARIGSLHIPMSARFVINDGQHRRAAIEQALRDKPELADESIAVVFFIDAGLRLSQQMFADLNRYAVKPSKSLGVLYDHRDDRAEISRQVVSRSRAFRGAVEMERSTLSSRSKRLFTFSAIYTANNTLLQDLLDIDSQDKISTAVRFWDCVAEQFPEWQDVRAGNLKASELRQDYIHTNGIALQAIARVGCWLLAERPDCWGTSIAGLSGIDWSRENAEMWEGRAMVGGRLSNSTNHVILTCNAIKSHLGLDLTVEETRIEEAFKKGENNGE